MLASLPYPELTGSCLFGGDLADVLETTFIEGPSSLRGAPDAASFELTDYFQVGMQKFAIQIIQLWSREEPELTQVMSPIDCDRARAPQWCPERI